MPSEDIIQKLEQFEKLFRTARRKYIGGHVTAAYGDLDRLVDDLGKIVDAMAGEDA